MKKMKMSEQRLKKTTLAIGLVVGLAFSIFMGVTAGSMGFGSMYPGLNSIAGPFVCPGKQMVHSRQVSQIGSTRYYTATWYCVDERLGKERAVESNAVFFYAGIFYGLAFFIALLLISYVYWNSSIGPAKNGGPRLW
jgi:hypothetical protein